MSNVKDSEAVALDGQMSIADVSADLDFEEINVSSTSAVVQSNYLIEEKPVMTLDEQRMFQTLVAAISRDQEDLQHVLLRVKDVIKLWDIPRNNAYKQVKKALAGLLDKKFALETTREDGTKFIEMTTYISRFSYGEGDGYATIVIDPLFKPYLIDLKERFTQYGLENILKLDSPVAMRTYELLMQYLKIGKRKFNVLDYKRKVGIEDKYVGNNSNLRKCVLDKVVVEISEKTQIMTRYEMKGRGDSAEITFVIYGKEETGLSDPSLDPNFASEEKDMMAQFLRDHHHMDEYFSDDQIQRAIEIATDGAKTEEEVFHSLPLIVDALRDYRDRAFDTDIKMPWSYFSVILKSKVDERNSH